MSFDKNACQRGKIKKFFDLSVTYDLQNELFRAFFVVKS